MNFNEAVIEGAAPRALTDSKDKVLELKLWARPPRFQHDKFKMDFNEAVIEENGPCEKCHRQRKLLVRENLRRKEVTPKRLKTYTSQKRVK